MRHVLFVGEKRSATAKRMNVRWEDGRLAAKQLFDAFDAVGFPRYRAIFTNAFERHGMGIVESYEAYGWPIVAMGQKVQAKLRHLEIPHISVVHPAARGFIRGKKRYAAEVRRALKQAGAL